MLFPALGTHLQFLFKTKLYVKFITTQKSTLFLAASTIDNISSLTYPEILSSTIFPTKRSSCSEIGITRQHCKSGLCQGKKKPNCKNRIFEVPSCVFCLSVHAGFLEQRFHLTARFISHVKYEANIDSFPLRRVFLTVRHKTYTILQAFITVLDTNLLHY